MSDEKSQKETIRQIGKMLEAMGQVLNLSVGNGEQDFKKWFKICEPFTEDITRDQIKRWYVTVLCAAGVIDYSKGNDNADGS